MKTLTGVGWYICAAHREPNGTVHGHTWEVKAWHECADRNDAVALQMHLRNLLETLDHDELPPHMVQAEDLAAVVLQLSPPSCVAVDVWRGPERLYARVER